MVRRKRLSAKQRIAVFNNAKGICHICGGRVNEYREAWDVEHEIPLALGGLDEESNWRLAHRKCHRSKTSSDMSAIAKSHRVYNRMIGAHRPKSPMPCGRQSPWKRKLNGTVVRRDD
ncbi:HNH endonuclease [Methyloligella solikamskensis]|uniref:HNH endonuclease n=1 Tax=Methyloligella solikamskensis TaxID=1177756 RepID=A0ABW3JAW8_9HYPH